MSSFNDLLDYSCIAEESEYPRTKICKYNDETPINSLINSEKITQGTVFLFVKLHRNSTLGEDSWFPITLSELSQLETNPDTLSIKDRTYEEENNQKHSTSCALCDDTVSESQYRIIYGFNIINLHASCFNTLINHLRTVVDSANVEIVSQTI